MAMGTKDIVEKTLEGIPEIFADIVNGLLFHGEQIIFPDELEDMLPRSIYKLGSRAREMERDVVKRWKKNNIRIAVVGLENQSEEDPLMPLRIYGYNGAEYQAQVRSDERPCVPVVTLVLYFGYKKRWSTARNLYEAVDVPEIFRPYVEDIKINLFEIAYLSREQVELFQSDFRIVADYFVQMRETGDYRPKPEKVHHIQEVLQLLSAVCEDKRFEETLNGVEKEEVQTMCDVLDRIENRGFRNGQEIGQEKGMKMGENKMAKLVSTLLALGRMVDIERVAADPEYREALYQEFGIA